MSVIYDINEHLIIGANASEMNITSIMQYRLSLFAALMLQGDINFHPLQLTADGKTYTFNGTEVMPELNRMMDAIGSASSLDLFMSYTCTWHADDLSEDAVPFPMIQMFENTEKEDLDNIFYSSYIQEESNCDNVGTLRAYGTKNGTYYHGEIEYLPEEHLPESGFWYNPNFVLCYDDDDLSGKDVVRIKAVCEEMCKLSPDDTRDFSMTEQEISFCISQITMHGGEPLNRFIQLMGELLVLSGGKMAICAEFLDMDSKDGHFVRADYNKDGSYNLFSAEVK